MKPGDIALFRPVNPVGWAISADTLSRYCHVRLVTSENGDVMQSTFRRGVKPGRVEDGDVIVSPPLTDEQRAKISTLAAALDGVPYGFLDVFALLLASFGIRAKWLERWVGREDRLICSQLVDVVWSRAGFQAFADGRLAQDVNPGDLADKGLSDGWSSYTYREAGA